MSPHRTSFPPGLYSVPPPPSPSRASSYRLGPAPQPGWPPAVSVPGPEWPPCCPPAGRPGPGPLWPVDTEPHQPTAAAGRGDEWERCGAHGWGLREGPPKGKGPWGRGPWRRGSGPCLAVQPLHVLPEACALLLQRPQLLLRLLAGAWRAAELALGEGDGERLPPGGGAAGRGPRGTFRSVMEAFSLCSRAQAAVPGLTVRSWSRMVGRRAPACSRSSRSTTTQWSHTVGSTGGQRRAWSARGQGGVRGRPGGTGLGGR